jgi:anti-anti-sigma factor
MLIDVAMMHSVLHLSPGPDGCGADDPDSLLLVRLSGDVDPPDAPALERCARAACRASRVHLDLQDVDFAGAFFAGWLLALSARLEDRGIALSLRAPARRLTRLLVALDLADRFDVLADTGPLDLPAYASTR